MLVTSKVLDEMTVKNNCSQQVGQFFCRFKNCRLINNKLAIVFHYGNVEMPTIKNQKIDLTEFHYIGFQNTRQFDERQSEQKTVGFFIHDKKFQGVLNRPWNYVNWLKQYKQVMTPDVSCYYDMSVSESWESVFLNRLIGVYWQEQGLIVIPTLSWGNKDTFSYCFSGIEKGTIVAISTIGTAKNKPGFMAGFIEMCQRIEPELVICYCRPYPEMFDYAKIFMVEHEGARKKKIAASRPVKGQLSLFEEESEEVRHGW